VPALIGDLADADAKWTLRVEHRSKDEHGSLVEQAAPIDGMTLHQPSLFLSHIKAKLGLGAMGLKKR
jgi:hypothetical protein